MSKHELSQEITTIKELIAEEARDIVELTEELIDLEEHAGMSDRCRCLDRT